MKAIIPSLKRFSLTAMAALGLVLPAAAASVEEIEAEYQQHEQEARSDILREMKQACNDEGYSQALKQIPSMGEYRRFFHVVEHNPQPVPFSQLSAMEAQKSRHWFSESKVHVYPTAESVDYYNKELFPAYAAFFRKFALSERSEKLDIPVGESSGGSILLRIADKANELCRGHKAQGYTVILMRTGNSDFRSAKVGSTLPAEVIVFKLPPAYGAFAKSQNTQWTDAELVRLIKDEGGKQIVRSNIPINIGKTMYTNKNTLVIQGFGAGHSMEGDVLLSSCAAMRPFCIFENDMARATGKLHFEYSLKNPTTLHAEQVASIRAKKAPGFFSYLMLVIVVIPWLSFPIMLYMLIREHRRRHTPLPLPAGWHEGMYNPAALTPECDEYIELSNSLKKYEVKDKEVRLFSSRDEVNRGFEWLQKVTAMNHSNPDTIYFINLAGAELNKAQTRYLIGSKLAMVIAILVFLLNAFLMWVMGHQVVGIAWGLFALIYPMSMFCPAYKLVNLPPPCSTLLKGAVKGTCAASIFLASKMASTTYVDEYVYVCDNGSSNGNSNVGRHRVEDYNTGPTIGALILGVTFVFSAFIFLVNAIGNFIRNYVTSE